MQKLKVIPFHCNNITARTGITQAIPELPVSAIWTWI